MAKFVHEAGLVAFEIIQDGFHAREYSETAEKAKRIETVRSLESKVRGEENSNIQTPCSNNESAAGRVIPYRPFLIHTERHALPLRIF